MKFIIAGGGTGGHIFPAVAIGKALIEEKNDVLFLARKNGFEEEIFKNEGFNMLTIRASPFEHSPVMLINFYVNLLKGFFNSLRIIKNFKPDAVIGTGGYVSAPVLLASVFLKIPVFLQEQNRVIGKANRLFSRFAKKIFLGFPVDLKNGIFTGNPIRKEIINIKMSEALKKSGFLKDRTCVLIMGGSRGSAFINSLGIDLINRIKEKGIECNIFMITGNEFYNENKDLIERINKEQSGKTLILPFSREIDKVLGVSDIAVTRGGALALTELVLSNIFSFIIPYPYAKDGHQLQNALYLKEKKVAKVFDEKNIDKEQFNKEFIEFLNKYKREDFVSNFENIFPKDSASIIKKEIYKGLKEIK